MAVEWFEAEVDGDQLAGLVDYDHHRFRIGDRSVVLITYRLRRRDNGKANPTVLAVHHGAAERHPALPERARGLVDDLRWRSTSPPPAECPPA